MVQRAAEGERVEALDAGAGGRRPQPVAHAGVADLTKEKLNNASSYKMYRHVVKLVEVF